MKFNCGPTWQERRDAKQEWHLWFAWRPVRIASGDCRWLEYVWCKGTVRYSWLDEHWRWEYRGRENGRP